MTTAANGRTTPPTSSLLEMIDVIQAPIEPNPATLSGE
jgi:hypothetical protein